MEDMDESARIIQKNLEKAGKLIRNFKMVSTDQSASQKRTFNLKTYIEEVVMTLRPMIDKNKVAIEVDCDGYIDMNDDPGLISQIFTNLIQNAITHGFSGNQGETIMIDVKEIENEIIFNFSDNGAGMAENAVSKIFEPFYTTKRAKGGTGLGMYIVYNIITQQYGGTIKCHSKLGEGGTTFTARWPMKHS